MSNTNEASNWYTAAFKGWADKLKGKRPTADQLSTIHGLGARPGKQALACAMALRDSGVTAGQIVMACGAPQLNKMRGFITDGLLKREAVAPDAQGHQVYKLTLTAKGKQRVERTAKQAADAAAKGDVTGDKPVAKAKKAASKPRKAADKPVIEPVTPAVQVDAGQADQPQA